MLQHSKFSVFLAVFRKIPAIAAIVLISGCANTLTTQVSNFNQWPTDAAGASFSVNTTHAAASAHWGDLEERSYENLVGQALQAQGLHPAATASSARFLATLRLDTQRSSVTRSEPVYASAPYPYAWGGYPYFGPYGWMGGPFGWWAATPVYMGERHYQQAVGIYLLSVRITDRSQKGDTPQGAPVFESSAQYAGLPAQIPALMPYLVQSIFNDFPGHNGQVRQVEFDLSKAPSAAPTTTPTTPSP